MRTVATALAFAAIVLAPVGASAGVTPGCQDAIAAGGAKFAKAALKIGQRCAIRGGAGAASCQPAAGGLTGNPAVDAGIARAAIRLAARVRGACAGSDLSAYARPCTGTDSPSLGVPDLVACLRDTHLEEVAQLLAVEFPALVSTTAADAAASGCANDQPCQCKCSPSGAFLEPAAEYGS